MPVSISRLIPIFGSPKPIYLAFELVRGVHMHQSSWFHSKLYPTGVQVAGGELNLNRTTLENDPHLFP